MIFKIACSVFLILFTINWICLLSTLHFRNFRYGDYIIIIIFISIFFYHINNIRNLGRNLPDLISIALLETKEQSEVVQEKVRKSKNVGEVVLMGIIEQEINKHMSYALNQ